MSEDCSGFGELVQQQIERLTTKKLQTIEGEVIAKRNAWWDRQERDSPSFLRKRPLYPRDAYEALFFTYMGLSPDDIPVVHEDEWEIVWSSRNHCPTLDACKQLGLDTRTVCRGAYEKSTQAFVSRLDPQLRFLRDYTEIRPHSSQCLERITRISFEDNMRIALEEAKLSRREGNKGYGAVAVLGNRILAQEHDTAITERDPSQHAEMKALRKAAQVLGDGNLSGVVLFSTCEPCPMCATMAVWSNVSAIVFGATIIETAAQGRSRIMIPVQNIVDSSPVCMELYSGTLREECLSLYL